MACPANMPAKSPLPCFSGSKILPFAYQNAPKSNQKNSRFGISPSKTDSFLGTTTLATIFLIAVSNFLNLFTKSTAVAEVLGDRQWQPELCQSHYRGMQSKGWELANLATNDPQELCLEFMSCVMCIDARLARRIHEKL